MNTTEVDLFTGRRLRRLLIARGASADADDAMLLSEARSPRHKLGATLLSAWAAERRNLPPGGAENLAAHRSRADFYERLARTLGERAAVRIVKGPDIAARYPKDVVRAAGDLDLICDGQDDLWSVVRTLLDRSWEVTAFTVLPGSRRESRWNDLMVELRTPERERLGVPYVVGISTVDVATSLNTAVRTLPAAARSGTCGSLVALAAERFERPFASRDLLDAVLLTNSSSDVELGLLEEALTEIGLWPEWLELCKRVARADLGGLPLADRARGLAARDRARRVLRSLRGWRPLQVPGRIAATTVDADRGRVADWVSLVVHERIGVRRLMSAGLAAYGIPLDDNRYRGFELVQRRRRTVALTPIGSFILVGGACRSEWLEEATDRRPDRAAMRGPE
ncbi:hypothetical protein [Glycomyces salinus]|uniref:hypothetical protein n=1 Tax=Glycomyces salinus TaxID=980294 RepID=UPI0018EAE4DA|nr:hypothetical protein [Glycomyces salinus]